MNTKSVCSVCAADVPAKIELGADNEVLLRKECVRHGPEVVQIERDAEFYMALRANACVLYPGHFIDVTDRCPLTCPYCYYPCNKGKPLPTIDEIVAEASSTPYPPYLTGGEPTTRDDLVDIFDRLRDFAGGAGMPTNGIGLTDRARLREILSLAGRYTDPLAMKSVTNNKAAARISLSYHPGQNEKVFHRVIENVRSLGDMIAGPIFVMNSLDDLPEIMRVSAAIKDACHMVRIHVATDVWDGKGATVYMSDFVRAFEALAIRDGKHFLWFPNGSWSRWVRAWYDGMHLALIRWPTKHDIDLGEYHCPPTYRANNGEITTLIHGFIINEAMQRGWMKGKQLYADI